MKKIILILILIAGLSYSQTFKKTGTSGFTFLEVPVSARTAGLGETSISLPDLNSEGVFSNPAALGFTKQESNLFVNYTPYFADIKHLAAAFAYHSDWGTLAISFNQMNYGDITKTAIPTDASQGLYQILGTYNASSLALGVAYSKSLTDKFSFGVQIKYVREDIDIYKATNLVFDGGILYYTGLGSLRIAATMQNFGVNAKFLNELFRMPTLLKLGAAMEVIGDYNSSHRLTILAEAVHPNDADEKIHLGAEYCWDNMLSLRAGYKFFYDEETYSFGAGINPQLPLPVNFDFAFSNYGRLGNVLRFSMQIGL